MANISLKDIQFPGLNNVYKVPEVDSTLTQSGAAADAKKTGDELSDLKQDFSKYHPDLGSGYSAQLLSTVFIEDEVPYNFRTSGGSADIGDREYDEIVGVSMPINQLVQNGNFADGINNWAELASVTGGIATSTSRAKYQTVYQPFNWVMGHKYLADVVATADSTRVLAIAAYNGTSATNVEQFNVTQDVFARKTVILTPANSPTRICVANWSEGAAVIKIKEYQCIDLTLLLGTAIADYVYGLEQSTAGSGVTWLKHHFPKIFDSGYIPYNAGEMQSVSGLSVHRMTGFNQWDGIWEDGGISDATGLDETDYIAWRSKNYIGILPNTVYYAQSSSTNKPIRARFYDANKNYIGAMAQGGYVMSGGTFTTPDNAYYMRISPAKTNIPNHDICINLHWDGERDGQYEEYEEYEYALDDSVVLRGILKLDSSNSLYADGDRYLADGTVERRYGVVDLGTLNWVYNESDQRFVTSNVTDISMSQNFANIVCQKYVTVSSATGYANMPDKSIKRALSAADISIKDLAYTDATTFKTAMSGVKLVYEKATATTETAEPYQTPQIVDDWGTEEYVSTSLVPVGHDTKYANNLRAKLEMSPDSPEENGDYIVRHNNGENEYVALGSTTTIQGILDRLTALENA